MRPRTPRLSRGLPALSLLVVLAAACEGAGRPAEAGVTVTVFDPAHEIIFNPVWDMPAKFLLFSPLVAFDESGDIEPRLARSWENSPDGREWTYHLRTDVRWHDGVPFTARDVAFSIELLSHPAIGSYPTPVRVRVPDDSTISIRFRRPRSGDDWWNVFYPRHLLESADPETFFEWDFWTRPVGNGPYRWERHVPRQLVELRANPDYFKGAPRIDRLFVKFGGGAPLAELLSGGVDAATFVSRPDARRLRADPRFRVYYQVWPDVGWLEGIFWNASSPLFSDARVRRALTMAIDREELRALQGLPADLPLFDVLFTGRQYWAGEVPAPLPHDPDAAAGLLSEAGWRDRDGDGVRERDGRPLRFSALVEGSGPAATHSYGQAAVYVQRSLAEVGVAMEIVQLEAGLRRRLQSGDYEAAFSRLFQPHAHDWFVADSATGWQHPRVRQVLEALRDAHLDEARDSLYGGMWPILAEEVPITFLGPQVQWFAAHRKIRGLSSPFRARTLMHLEHAWVDQAP